MGATAHTLKSEGNLIKVVLSLNLAGSQLLILEIELRSLGLQGNYYVSYPPTPPPSSHEKMSSNGGFQASETSPGKDEAMELQQDKRLNCRT